MSKSIASTMSYLSTSYEKEIQDVKAKIAYWNFTASNHAANGFHIMADLYREYAKKAQKELEELLEIEKEEQKAQANKTPKRFFLKQVSCSYYKPVLPALEKEIEETEDFINEDKTLSYESIPSVEIARIS